MNRDATRDRRPLRSWTDISDFNNIHSGKKCFIVGAGPSVGFLNLDKIHDHVVISVNSSILLMPWDTPGNDSVSRFWISNDSLCLKWTYFWTHVVKFHCVKIVRTSWKKHEDKIRGYDFRYFEPRKSQSAPLLDDDGLCSVSSIPTAIDFAIKMNCKSIYLLGVDQRLIHTNSHFWQFWDKSKWPQRKDKGRNFRPEQKHQIKVFKENLSVFKALKQYAASKDIKIYNCSNRSKLEVFDSITIDQAYEKS